MAIAPSVAVLIVGRVLDRVGIGFVSAVGLLYIAEIAPAKIRGSLVTFNDVAIWGGILLSHITDQTMVNMAMGAELFWRMMPGQGMILATVLFIGIIFMPESPDSSSSRTRNDRNGLS